MKNKNLKLAALGLVLFVGIAALYKMKAKKQINTNENKTANSGDTIPNEFYVNDPKDANAKTKYWFDGSDYWMHYQSPSARTTPVKITKEEYQKAYSDYLA